MEPFYFLFLFYLNINMLEYLLACLTFPRFSVGAMFTESVACIRQPVLQRTLDGQLDILEHDLYLAREDLRAMRTLAPFILP